MAVSLANFYRAALPTSSGTLNTAAGGGWMVTNIVIANTTATTQTVTISLDGVALLPGVAINGNTAVPFDLKQFLAATKLITGVASAAGVSCHISGAVL